jgi:hypothetical protein
MASPAKLSHVALYSQQVPVICDWYVRLLDGRVVHEASGVAFLTYDDEHHRIAIADSAAMREVRAEALVGDGSGPAALSPKEIEIAALPPHGLAHIAFTYPTLQDLLENWERLKNESVLPVLAINHGPTTPAGVGLASGSYLKAGDTVEVAIEGIGHLRNAVTVASCGNKRR